MNIPKAYKLVPVELTAEMYAAASVDSREQGFIGSGYRAMLAAAPTPPQPIYDEAKRIAELEQALAGMLFAFDDGVGLDWSEDLLDFARKLTPAVEFQSRAKAGEVGHE